ncbi:MAG: HDOD domain-containing protein [Deltaproteobacteria bacterium]|nr:HDOD domain-containing protein [Deltaproteobacteria bacterium]
MARQNSSIETKRPASVLFVDDDALMRRVLPRMLRLVVPDAECRVAESGADALSQIEAREPDLVISDLEMQPMDGVELLGEVQRRWPRIVRLVITGEDAETVLGRLAPVSHGLLPKPFEPKQLLEVYRRASRLSGSMNHPRIADLIGRSEELPAAPRVYRALLFVLTNPCSGAPEAGEVVARDPAIAAQVMRVASSPYFCRSRAPATLSEAVNRIGLSALEALVLSMEAHRSFPLGAGTIFDVEESQRQSLLVAHLARRLVHARPLAESGRPGDGAFLAGLLHRVGSLALASRATALFAETRALVSEGWPEVDAERRVLGVTQAEVGAQVLGLWGLSAEVVEAVGAQDEDRPDDGAVTQAVRSAVVIAERARSARIESSWLEMLGLRPSMPVWKELVAPAA